MSGSPAYQPEEHAEPEPPDTTPEMDPEEAWVSKQLGPGWVEISPGIWLPPDEYAD
jgi:hypothetical protein